MSEEKNIYSRAIFIDNLRRELVKLCTSKQMLNNMIYDIPELMEKSVGLCIMASALPFTGTALGIK